MNITTSKTTMVRPVQDTPRRTIWNSNIDLVVAPNHLPTVYFYRPNGSSHFFDANVLTESLSRVLVQFYPMAGRLKRDQNGRIEIDCNGDGVLFVEAETNAVLDDFGEFAPSMKFRQLVPAVDYSKELSSYPIAIAQVTYFKCGGVSFATSIHHTVTDGIIALQFINTWSDAARGIEPKLALLYDRTLLRARDPPRPMFQHVEFHDPPALKARVKSASKDEILEIVSVFKFTSDQLDILKSKVKESGSAVKYSTFETFSGHIWRSVCKARELANGQACKLYILVNGRPRLRPSLPTGYFGNCIFASTSMAFSNDIISEPLWYTVNTIHDCLARMDDEYLRSSIDYLETQPDVAALARGAHTFKCPNLSIVDWSRLPIHKADFGWGRPFYMGPTNVAHEGLAFVLPSPTNDESLSLAIRLPSHHMKLFAKYFYEI